MTDWQPHSLIKEACAVDGLSDFGDDSHSEPLRQLLYSLEHEAQLNAIGTMVLRQRVVDVLATRLRVTEWLKRHPEIRQEVISSPLVIVGLPRTGTTMLHRTIAADHRMYAPLWYETRFPCPALDWDPDKLDQRIVDGKAEMQAMLDANPDLLSVHPMDAMGPDEDIMLLEQSFYSFTMQSFANLPTFDRWIEAQDHRPGYEYLKLLLQFLQWQKKRSGQSAQRWTIKAPHHLHYMELVFEVFPDARVVQSHRDPLDTIPSLASMISEIWSIYSDCADPVEVGRQWARKFARGMNHTMDVRQRVGEQHFLDLQFEDTVKRPLLEIQKVYDFINMDFSEQAKAEMLQWQDFNSRELRPSHEYTLGQFGYTEQGLHRQFARYRERFIL